MRLNLSGKSVVITGAGGGLGQEIDRIIAVNLKGTFL